jgi:hypothetical protein
MIRHTGPVEDRGARRRLMLIGSTVVVLCGAIVLAVIFWIVTTIAGTGTSRGPSSFALAQRIHAAYLGCDDAHAERDPDGNTYENSLDEAYCGTGDSYVLIARFADHAAASTATLDYQCRGDLQAYPNRNYVLGDNWIVYPTTASLAKTRAIADALGGTVAGVCDGNHSDAPPSS